MIINLREMKERNIKEKRLSSIKIVCKTHYNGIMQVSNVPYIQMDHRGHSRDYLTYEVLKNLSIIYKYMEEHHITEMDYQEFISIRNFDLEQERPAQKNFDANNQKEIIRYVKNEWLNNYFKWELQSHSSDPELVKNAKEKLDYFHEKLSKLSELHQEIIKLKYLQKDENGRYPLDDFVYPQLLLGRTSYYAYKKEALYLLGLALKQQSK